MTGKGIIPKKSAARCAWGVKVDETFISLRRQFGEKPDRPCARHCRAPAHGGNPERRLPARRQGTSGRCKGSGRSGHRRQRSEATLGPGSAENFFERDRKSGV